MVNNDIRRRGGGLGRMLLAVTTALLVALPAQAAGGDKGTGAEPKVSTKGYDYYLSGSALDAVPAQPKSRMFVLMGGGEDVDAAFQQLIAKARGGVGGKVDMVVIRTSGADGYNPYLMAMDGVDSVETLVLKTREAANDPQVNEIVNRADVLFIAGGDQSTYVKLWTGTALDTTLKTLRLRNVPFGGTSAGLAVLGAVDYTGENGSVTSAEALANPYDKRVTLSTRFIADVPGLEHTITDSHLQVRDRMGRLVTFVARMIKDNLAPVGAARGIGVDEGTAVVVEGATARVVGAGWAYFVMPTIAGTTVEARKPLEIRSVAVRKLGAGTGSFEFASWGSKVQTPYYLDAAAGTLTSSQGDNSPY